MQSQANEETAKICNGKSSDSREAKISGHLRRDAALVRDARGGSGILAGRHVQAHVWLSVPLPAESRVRRFALFSWTFHSLFHSSQIQSDARRLIPTSTERAATRHWDTHVRQRLVLLRIVQRCGCSGRYLVVQPGLRGGQERSSQVKPEAPLPGSLHPGRGSALLAIYSLACGARREWPAVCARTLRHAHQHIFRAGRDCFRRRRAAIHSGGIGTPSDQPRLARHSCPISVSS
jgi:hypothetical protein